MHHKGTVRFDQGGHIRDRGQCHKIQHAHQIGAFLPGVAQLSPGLDQHQKHHTRCAKIPQIAGFILPVGIYHGKCGWQGFPAQMVIEHNHVRPFGGSNRAVGQGAAIHTDDQIVGCGQFGHGLIVRAVPFIDPVGHI